MYNLFIGLKASLMNVFLMPLMKSTAPVDKTYRTVNFGFVYMLDDTEALSCEYIAE